MRLTLRTLLSYLDDTLEPSQAKAIGTKVAESEQARELMERIKQVTRRRRLTSPPTSGPGGIDPNTIAEYLDNEVTPEKAAEVEQICLASDVHLAEVAACHQILTLVLGEPALVPPSAKQRMVRLVKGAEAIRDAKPAKAKHHADMDLSGAIEVEHDDTLRLGVPSIALKRDYRNLWILVGGGSLAACLLLVAFWQLLHSPDHHVVEPKGNDVAMIEPKDVPKNGDVPPAKEVKPKEIVEKKDPPKVVPAQKNNEFVVEDVVLKKDVPIEFPFEPASLKQLPVGLYLPPPAQEPGVLLQVKPDKSGWMRVAGKKASVFSGRPILSLPGSKSVVQLDSGVELMLWGNLAEVTLDPMLLESRVLVHANDKLDADFTLQRGRVIVTNKKGLQDARVRVRFESPTSGEENHFDVVLQGPEAAVALERFCELPEDEPFYEDPKDPRRNGPIATIKCFGYAGSASVRYRQSSYTVDRDRQPIVQWQSRQEVLGPPEKTFIPYWLKGIPKLTKEDELTRKNAIKAHEMLVGLLEESKPIHVALSEMIAAMEKDGKAEIAMEKRISLRTFFFWRHALRCYMAIDDVSYLFDQFNEETTMLIIRGICMQTLHQWIGLDRDHDYQLLDLLRNTYKYKKTESVKIMELFHGISEEDARKPAKYQQLIDGLTNEHLPIRVLSHWHLFVLVPAGQAIPYDPAGPRQLREEAERAWRRLIPPGQLPPMGPPPTTKKK